MTRRKIEKIRREIEGLRRKGGVRASELESLAKRLGRRRAKRGGEPTWVSDSLPGRPPVSVPAHPGDLNRYTARSILDQLERDLDELELAAEDAEEDDDEEIQ
jgi:hypothetical protein